MSQMQLVLSEEVDYHGRPCALGELFGPHAQGIRYFFPISLGSQVVCQDLSRNIDTLG